MLSMHAIPAAPAPAPGKAQSRAKLAMPAALADDFDDRFLKVCKARGLSVKRCQCTLEVIKDAIADEHLEVMLTYFEGEAKLDPQKLAEFDLDDTRYQELKGQIDGAVLASRNQCKGT